MEPITVRAASTDDAAAVCRIYNEGIEDRLATLETELRTPEERRAWITAREPRHPVLVAEVAGDVVGWSSLNRFNARPAYEHVADFSVYVARPWRGRGVGRVLLGRVIDVAAGLGYHKLVLAALAVNAPGEALYTRMGFRRVGIYREQGLLDGRWMDVLIMERLL